MAAAHGAHVHGIATLDVALDGERLEVHLEAPGDTAVGFEHPPRDDAERNALANAKAVLGSPPRWITPPPDARCGLETHTLDAGGYEQADAKQAGGGHADIDVQLAWQCAAPDRLDALEIALFGHFPRLQQIKVNLVLPGGQDSRVLTPGTTRLRLAP